MTSTLSASRRAPVGIFINSQILAVEQRLVEDYVGTDELEIIANVAAGSGVPLLSVCATAPREKREEALAIWRKNEFAAAFKVPQVGEWLGALPAEIAEAVRAGKHSLAAVDTAVADFIGRRNRAVREFKEAEKAKLWAACREHVVDAADLPHDQLVRPGFVVISANGEMRVSRRRHHAVQFGRDSAAPFLLITCDMEKTEMHHISDETILSNLKVEATLSVMSDAEAGTEDLGKGAEVPAPPSDPPFDPVEEDSPGDTAAAGIRPLDLRDPDADDSRPASARGLTARNAARRGESSS